jgi:hypothetical protein
MIQVQKHQNWSKFYQKLQKEPKISIMGTRRNFFRVLKIPKKGVEHQMNQLIQNLFDFK